MGAVEQGVQVDGEPASSTDAADAKHPERPTRLDSLTQARFVAALAVVLFHGCIEFHAEGTWYGLLSQSGFVGVSFFFVLSGFVLAWSSKPQERPGRFYWNRFARIWPIYALTWFAAVLYAAVGHGTVLWRPVLLGTVLVQAWDPRSSLSYNFPAWSLSVEAFFYLLFPLIIVVVRRSSRSQALVVVVLGYVWTVTGDVAARASGSAQAIDWITYSFPPYRLGEFVAGMGLAVALRKGWRPRVPLAVPLVYLALLAVANGFWFQGAQSIDRDLLTLLAIPAACGLVASLARRDLAGRGRRRAVLLRLGEASYALYIVHAIVIFAWGGLRLPFSSRYLLLYIAVSVAAALVLHQWVERPAERWLRSHRPGLRHVRTETSREPARAR